MYLPFCSTYLPNHKPYLRVRAVLLHSSDTCHASVAYLYKAGYNASKAAMSAISLPWPQALTYKPDVPTQGHVNCVLQWTRSLHVQGGSIRYSDGEYRLFFFWFLCIRQAESMNICYSLGVTWFDPILVWGGCTAACRLGWGLPFALDVPCMLLTPSVRPSVTGCVFSCNWCTLLLHCRALPR